MTLANLSLEVGRNLQYLNAGRTAWLTGRGVVEADAKVYINQVYREELFPLLSNRYANMFRRKASATALLATGVIDSISTSTVSTVNTTTAIFNNSMEGLFIYNATQEDYFEIKTYTDADTVVMASDVSDSWSAGETIYVMAKELIMDGDAEDLHTVEQVELKYTDVLRWTPAEKRNEKDLNRFGTESYSASDPKWYLTTVVDSDVRKWAVGVDPGFKDPNGKMQVIYVEKPAVLTDSDSPFIPIDDALIAGATLRAYRNMKDSKGISFWTPEYLRRRTEMLNEFVPSKKGGVFRRRQGTRAFNIRNRRV